jgi:hypothetical protein
MRGDKDLASLDNLSASIMPAALAQTIRSFSDFQGVRFLLARERVAFLLRGRKKATGRLRSQKLDLKKNR